MDALVSTAVRGLTKAHRTEYLVTAAQDIINDFLIYSPYSHCRDVWFSIGDITLPSFLPIGVIFDSFTFPFTILIHYSNRPSNILQQTPASIMRMFNNTFKEAAFITDQKELLNIFLWDL